MPDVAELNRLIKQTALDAIEATNPVTMTYGKVITTSPLQINVEQKMTLGEAQLILTDTVREQKIVLNIDLDTDSFTHSHTITEPELITDEVTHKHSASTKKEILIRKGLSVGDKVLLVRMQGGQKFIVIDRM